MMERAVTFLELLEMIKKGNRPEKVKFFEKWFYWDEWLKNYVTEDRTYLSAKAGGLMGMPAMIEKRAFTVFEPVLDEIEKEFVRNALVPMKAKRIRKDRRRYGPDCYENIQFKTDKELCVLPDFKVGTMYKGMEPGRWYELDEILK